jgi:hypothetical protein
VPEGRLELWQQGGLRDPDGGWRRGIWQACHEPAEVPVDQRGEPVSSGGRDIGAEVALDRLRVGRWIRAGAHGVVGAVGVHPHRADGHADLRRRRGPGHQAANEVGRGVLLLPCAAELGAAVPVSGSQHRDVDPVHEELEELAQERVTVGSLRD